MVVDRSQRARSLKLSHIGFESITCQTSQRSRIAPISEAVQRSPLHDTRFEHPASLRRLCHCLSESGTSSSSSTLFFISILVDMATKRPAETVERVSEKRVKVSGLEEHCSDPNDIVNLSDEQFRQKKADLEDRRAQRAEEAAKDFEELSARYEDIRNLKAQIAADRAQSADEKGVLEARLLASQMNMIGAISLHEHAKLESEAKLMQTRRECEAKLIRNGRENRAMLQHAKRRHETQIERTKQEYEAKLKLKDRTIEKQNDQWEECMGQLRRSNESNEVMKEETKSARASYYRQASLSRSHIGEMDVMLTVAKAALEVADKWKGANRESLRSAMTPEARHLLVLNGRLSEEYQEDFDEGSSEASEGSDGERSETDARADDSETNGSDSSRERSWSPTQRVPNIQSSLADGTPVYIDGVRELDL